MSSARITSKLLNRLAVAVALLVLLGPGVAAHEVPNEVTVSGFVRPQDQTLTVLLRVPLK